MATVVADAVVSKVVDQVADSVWSQIGYIWSFNSNVEALRDVVDKLKAERESVLHLVDKAKDQGEKIEQIVNIWLTNVDDAIRAAKEILEENGGAKKSCFMGCSPNLKTRYQLSRKARKELLPIVDGVRQEKPSNGISYRVAAQKLEIVRNYEEFESRTEVVNEIVEALKEGVNLIGVYGLGGVGKTTLMKQVTARVKEEVIFNSVAQATVTHTPDLKKIQQDIADWLGFHFDVDSNEVRAARLNARILQEEKILVILDDMWTEIELEKIGIPFGKIHKGCKILVTSRTQDVLLKMGVQKEVLLKVLQHEEAWSLFQTKVGDLANSPLRPIATEVAKRCGGLPILIVAVATALKNRELYEWKDALEELKRFDNKGIEKQVSSALELTYKFLEEDRQFLFFLCARLRGNHISIDDLLRYGIALGLFNQRNMAKAARNRLLKLVSDLKKSCLLLDDDEEGLVKMHDVVKNFAASVASKEHHAFIVAFDTPLVEWPEKEAFKNCTDISLVDAHIPELPQELECPQLKSFILYNKDSSFKIPENFFIKMKELKLLDLSDLHLSLFPSSVQYLNNLKTLCLDRCVMEDIAVIGKLKNLLVLSLIGSTLVRLPREIENLTRLQILDLSECQRLVEIPPNVLLCLTKLEELYMGNSFVKWEGEGDSAAGNNANLVELKNMSNLTTLDLHVIDAKIIPADVFNEKLESFKIFIGEGWNWSRNYRTKRTMKLKLEKGLQFQLKKVKVLLMKTEDLYLDHMEGIENVLEELDWQGFPKLKHLQVQNNHDIPYIIDCKGIGHVTTFPFLESFCLDNLDRLEKICNGTLMSGSLSNIRKLKVGNCNQLKNLFPFSTFKGFVKLEEIHLNSCKVMEEIVDGVGNEEGAIKFKEVHKLTLENLPRFSSTVKVSFLPGRFHKETASSSNYTEIVSEEQPQTSVQLFSQKIQFPNLKDLKLCSINVEKIWSHSLIEWFQNLTSLHVEHCRKLRYLFESRMVESVSQLKKLEVSNCISMEQIIEEEMEGSEFLFPKLQFLKLKHLPRLVTFSGGNFINCPSLKELRLDDCPMLRKFIGINSRTRCGNSILFDDKVAFPSLEELELLGLSELKGIWHDELPQDSFCKLKSLVVEGAKEVVQIFPPNWLERCQNVQVLVIKGCDALREVFDLRAAVDVTNRGGVEAPRLSHLFIEKLPNLKHVWNEDPQGILDFQNLNEVIVFKCPSLRSLFPNSIARGLMHLENLCITDSGVEEIVAGEEGTETVALFEFPKLNRLTLRRLPQLRRLYPEGIHISRLPELKELYVTQCAKLQQPIVSFAKIVPNLEKLALNSQDLRTVCDSAMNFIQKLKLLELNSFNERSTFFLFDLLRRFHNLETLKVVRSKFEELFPSEGLVGKEKYGMILGKIRFLELHVLPNLKTIWNQSSHLHQLLQTLESLRVWACDSLIILAPSSASFQSLTSLEVCKCNRLLSLMASSTAKSLMLLKKLIVHDCDMMKEIVSSEADETTDDVIIFNNLRYLNLVCLPRLTCFCSANHSFRFPYLLWVTVKQCPNMEVFSKGVSRTPMLQRVDLTQQRDRGDWLGNLNSTVNYFYNRMVGFCGMEQLKLSEFLNLKDRWHGELPVEVFSNLRSLVVDEGSFSLSAVPSKLLVFMNSLEELEVSNCELLEQVFELQSLGADERHNRLLSKLNRFHLMNLPRLRHLWNEYPQGILNFKCLESFKIHNCNNLRLIFTPSMARGLVHLQELEVKNCTSVEEITKEGEEAEPTEMIFPLLSSLVLESLPALMSFYSGRDDLPCPSLEKITAMDCPKIKVFPSSVPEEKEQNEIDKDNERGLGIRVFCGKVKCPKLKEVRVEWNSIREIWPETKLFCNLKVVELKDFPTEYSGSPSNFLERLPNLEKLHLNNACFEEIFPQQETTDDEEEHSRNVTQLKELKLSKLPQLRHLIKDQTKPSSVIQNLEALEIWQCTKLTILVPPSLSFRNLKTLKVSKCDGLLNLITSSTARSLTQLTRLEITECESVKEIVASEGDGLEEEIVFSELKHLGLHCLPSLTSFSPGLFPFDFPCLEEVIVKECPKMELFVKGNMSAPNLESVQTTEDGGEWRSDGSLNTTLQNLFSEMNAEQQ